MVLKGQEFELEVRIPLRATLLVLMELRASGEISSPPGWTLVVEKLWNSHSIGTLRAEKISITACEISGPIPSPGRRVTF